MSTNRDPIPSAGRPYGECGHAYRCEDCTATCTTGTEFATMGDLIADLEEPMTSPSDFPNISTIELERFTIAAEMYLSEQLAESFAISPETSVHLDNLSPYFGQLVLQIKQSVYGRDLDTRTVRYPADWWQAFKARWFPAWAKERWPVKETVVTWTARELFPLLAAPDHNSQAIILEHITKPSEYWNNYPDV